MNLLDFLRTKSFSKNVALLTAGTVLSQLILLASLPLLTRLYDPSDFGLLAIYLASTSFLGVVACLRFNVAIPLSKDNEESIYLTYLSLISCVLISLFIYIIISINFLTISNILNNKSFDDFILLIPLGIFLNGLYDTLQYRATKKEYFSSVSSTRITRAIISVAFQIAYALNYNQPGFGLIFGQIIYSGSGIILLCLKTYKELLIKLSLSKFIYYFKKNKKFPLISVPESFMNNAGNELPIIILSTLLAGPEIGFLMIALRIIGMPMGLVGSSISQVFSAELGKENKFRNTKKLTFSLMKNLLFYGSICLAGLSVIVFFTSDIIFGENWSRVGEIIFLFLPWYIFQLTASPVSIVLLSEGFFRRSFLLQLFGALLRILPLIFLSNESIYALEIFAFCGFLFYTVYCYAIIITLNNKGKK